LTAELDLFDKFQNVSRTLRRQFRGAPPDDRRGGGERTRHRKERPGGGLRTLEYVIGHPGVTSAELAAGVDIRPSSLSEALDHLQEEGVVRREKDENDSRITRVFPTDLALERQAELLESRRHLNRRLLSCLTQEEAVLFARLCDKICANWNGEEL